MRIHRIDNADRAVATRVVAIQRAAYAVEAELMSFDGIPPLHEDVTDVQSHERMIWHGAFEGTEIVGIISWFDHGDSVEIDRLAVDPAWSRRGYGRQLVRAVPRGNLVAVSTGTANYPAVALYESEGFRLSGTTEVSSGVFTSQFRRLSSAETPPVGTHTLNIPSESGGGPDREVAAMSIQTSGEIAQIACDILDLPAASARRIPVGFGNQNWRVESGDHEFVVKIGPAQSAPKWQAAALGLEIAREAGLPVPHLQFSGVLNGHCVRILDWIKGEPATALQGDPDRQARFGRDLGSAIASLHSVQLESFSSRLDGSAPRFDTWPDYVRHRLEQIRLRSTTNSAPEPALRLDAHDVIDAMLDSIALHCRPVVCHRDLHPDNLLVGSDGSLTAIIDWDMPEAWDAAGEWFKLNSMLFTVLPDARQPLQQYYFNGRNGEHSWRARTWLIEAIETLNVVSNAPNHSQKFTQSGVDQLRRLVTIGPPAPE